mgnify:CR=1 FL=1
MPEIQDIEIIRVMWRDYHGKKDYYVTILGRNVVSREYVTFESRSFTDQDIDELKTTLVEGRKVRISSENGIRFLEVNHFRLYESRP